MNRTKVSVFVEKDAIEVGGLTFVTDGHGDYVLGDLLLRHLAKEDEWTLYSNLQDITEKTPEECLAKARRLSNEIYMLLYSLREPEVAPVDLGEIPF